MEKKKTSVFSNGLIWFGAAISIAEIVTGTLIAPLGFIKGIFAIVIGHLIGCTLFYVAGLIGAKTKKSAMETVKIAFGEKGSLLFSSLNVFQLVGWTAVMIVTGTVAASSVVSFGGNWVWSIIIGALIIVWILVGVENVSKINMMAVSALFLLTIVLSTLIFRENSHHTFQESISFGSAVELSVAMPLSWLPLISDYTRLAKKPMKATAVSAIVYFLVSCWMYVIGLGAAIFTGESDMAKIMMSSGLGLMALIIIIFSTVTTTFLDAYSAGVSSESISKKLKGKPVAVIVTVIGTFLAIFAPITQFESFLYLIGSVFAPMIAILIADFFIIKKDSSGQMLNITNLLIWVAGFSIYRLFLQIDTPVGNTLPVMVIIILLCVITNKIFGGKTYA